ncbi:MAG: hypothetical protein IT318_11175 [Anaerolineales bacterium]|nr:hypothetical protein [Anaerolineales bacterium]
MEESVVVALRRPRSALLALAVLVGVMGLILAVMVAVGVYVARQGDPLLSLFAAEGAAYPAYVAPRAAPPALPSLPGENLPASLRLDDAG